jgi:hypothetical protein
LEIYPNKQGGILKWQIKLLRAGIVIQIFYSQKASKISLRKRDLKTNHKDVLIAEQQKSNSKEGITGAGMETLKEKCSQLYALNVEDQQLFHLDQTVKSQFIARIAINQ